MFNRRQLERLGLLLLLAASSAQQLPAAEPRQPLPPNSAVAERPAPDVAYHFCSLVIRVANLPASASHVPLTARIDFAEACDDGQPGVLDERSFRLFRVDPGGGETEIAVQFLPDERPRSATRSFLPETVEGVSYVTEWPAAQAKVRDPAGSLTWIAEPSPNGSAAYRLQFARATRGRAIQVPYAPADLRAFDDQGRATVSASFAQLQIRPQWPLEGRLHVLDGRQPVTTFHVGPSVAEAHEPIVRLRRPFLYPVYDPDGYALTEFGKPHDPTGSHQHHYSLWIAHADVAGQDFWSERGGIIAHEGWELLEDGPVFCRIAARYVWLAAGQPLLRERRTMTFYRCFAGLRAIDFELEYQPAGSSEVSLGDTTFGFLSVRTAQSMAPFDGGGEIVNSAGQRNEQAVHRQRARWLDLSGPVDQDRWSGIAVLDHPDNPNHPTPWHCRNDGWACAAVNHQHPHTLRPGQPLCLRYRLLLHPGDARSAGVADQFDGYAARPEIRLGRAQPQAAPVPNTACPPPQQTPQCPDEP